MCLSQNKIFSFFKLTSSSQTCDKDHGGENKNLNHLVSWIDNSQQSANSSKKSKVKKNRKSDAHPSTYHHHHNQECGTDDEVAKEIALFQAKLADHDNCRHHDECKKSCLNPLAFHELQELCRQKLANRSLKHSLISEE